MYPLPFSVHYDNQLLFLFRCDSGIGRLRKGRQELRLNDYCFEAAGNTMHELGHILGFYHEHNRSDRDEYIEIKWENIADPFYQHFQKIEREVTFENLPYDYGSIMHYTLDAYSKHGNTLKPLQPNVTVGQRVMPSEQDVYMANLLYDCKPEDSKFNYALQASPYLVNLYGPVACQLAGTSLNLNLSGHNLHF